MERWTTRGEAAGPFVVEDEQGPPSLPRTCPNDPGSSFSAAAAGRGQTPGHQLRAAVVRGAHVVVYDAEDVPEPDHCGRRKCLCRDHGSIACRRAGLRQRVRDAARGPFAEYRAVRAHLGLLSRWHLPMPARRTSNHFLTRSLRMWVADAYTVTRMRPWVRLAAAVPPATLDSKTHEEAPQPQADGSRTRWTRLEATLVVQIPAPRVPRPRGGPSCSIYVGSCRRGASHTSFFAASVSAAGWSPLGFPETLGWASGILSWYSGAWRSLCGLMRWFSAAGLPLQLAFALYLFCTRRRGPGRYYPFPAYYWPRPAWRTKTPEGSGTRCGGWNSGSSLVFRAAGE